MVTLYRHLATYFSFPSAILGDKTSGWLGCAAHGMRDITREPMRANFFFGPTSNLGFKNASCAHAHHVIVNFDLFALCIIIKAYARRQGPPTLEDKGCHCCTVSIVASL